MPITYSLQNLLLDDPELDYESLLGPVVRMRWFSNLLRLAVMEEIDALHAAAGEYTEYDAEIRRLRRSSMALDAGRYYPVEGKSNRIFKNLQSEQAAQIIHHWRTRQPAPLSSETPASFEDRPEAGFPDSTSQENRRAMEALRAETENETLSPRTESHGARQWRLSDQLPPDAKHLHGDPGRNASETIPRQASPIPRPPNGAAPASLEIRAPQPPPSLGLHGRLFDRWLANTRGDETTNAAAQCIVSDLFDNAERRQAGLLSGRSPHSSRRYSRRHALRSRAKRILLIAALILFVAVLLTGAAWLFRPRDGESAAATQGGPPAASPLAPARPEQRRRVRRGVTTVVRGLTLALPLAPSAQRLAPTDALLPPTSYWLPPTSYWLLATGY
jgi:hypothetical protein